MWWLIINTIPGLLLVHYFVYLSASTKKKKKQNSSLKLNFHYKELQLFLTKNVGCWIYICPESPARSPVALNGSCRQFYRN